MERESTVQLLEVHDAAKMIGVGPSRVRGLADLRALKVFARTPSGQRLFHPHDVAAFIKARARQRAQGARADMKEPSDEGR